MFLDSFGNERKVMAHERRTRLTLIRRNEQASKVLEILTQNRDGLTSGQIGMLAGMRLERTILLELKNEGKIRHKKGLSPDGRISLLYVLNNRR